MDVATATATVKRTRAQVYRDKVKIRLATDEAGPEIARVLKANNIEFPGADWSKCFPHWLIATVDDQVIGCIMVMTGKPVGFLEFLFVDPAVSFKLRAIAIKKLCFQGAATLAMAGGAYMCCTVDHINKKFYDVLKRYDAIHAGDTALMVKRLK